MTRLLRLAALALGAPLLLLLLGGLVLLLARLALAWFFPGVPEGTPTDRHVFFPARSPRPVSAAGRLAGRASASR